MIDTPQFAQVGEINICYDEFGEPDDPAVLLIMGIGAQMVMWRADFCRQLADQGYRVIRFDNRDSGLSTKLDDVPADSPGVYAFVRAALGIPVPGAAYTLEDMAADARGVLAHLGIERAHIVGASMGGMIAQVFAAEYAEQTSTLTAIMSSNNQALLPPAGPQQAAALLKRPPAGATREQILDLSVANRKVIGSPEFRVSDDEARALAAEYYDRSYSPAGFARQGAAVMGSGSLVRFNRRTTAPTLVLHGRVDKLVRVSGGRAIAKAIRGSELVVIDDMAHDLPRPLWSRVIGELTAHFSAPPAGDHAER